MPARPPRHPGREQQGPVPMNVRIPSSSASSIASGGGNTVPPSPASIASPASYQHNQRRTSHSNLKKKSFVVGGGSSRPGTADSAMTSASSLHAAREWERAGSNVVGAGANPNAVIDENDRDDDEYGNNRGSHSYLDLGSIHSLTAQRERERVEVTPWEFQALPEQSPVVHNDHHETMETSGTGPGPSSVFSSQQQHRPRSIKTSRVSASSVPPPPVPQLPPSPMLMSAGSGTNASVFSIPHSASAASTTHSIKAGAGGSVISPSVATGPMDEVTPWDMYPVGVTNVNNSSFQPNSTGSLHTPTSAKAPSSFSNNNNLSSVDLRINNNHSSVNLNSPVVGTKIIAPLANVISPSVATGPMDEVTPWDMYPVPEGSVTSSVMSTGGASAVSGERDRAGSASGGSAHGVTTTTKEEKKSSKGSAFGKIKAAVKSASGGGEMKRQRRGSSGAATGAGTIASGGGAPSVISGASGVSWASGSGAGLRPGQGQGGATPTAYNTTFFPQPVPPPPVPAIPSPVVVQQMAAGNRNPSNSFSSVTSTSTTASASTNATTPPNTPPLPSPAMPHMASSSSLSPTRAYFLAHPNHSAASANAGRGVNGSPRTTATIYHSPSTSTLGSVISAGAGGMTGSAVDLSGHGQYTPTSAIHKKQSLISTSSIGGGGAGSIPATPMTASSTAFSTSTVPHSIHTSTTSTGVSSSAMSMSSGAAATATGPVEDVTPWEMYPVPAHTILAPPPIPKDAATKKQRPRAGTVGSVVSAVSGKSGASNNGGGGNGSIGGGSPNPNNNVFPPGVGLQAGDGVGVALGGPGSGASRKSLPYSERSGGSSAYYKQNVHQTYNNQQQQPQAKTGPTEEVTPWELEDTLPPPPVGLVRIESGGGASTSSLPGSVGNAGVAGGNNHPASSSSSGLGVIGTGTTNRRARGSMTLEQLEEVMPWELSAPPPPSPPLPIAMSQSQSQGQVYSSSGEETGGGGGVIRERKSFKMVRRGLF